MWRFTLFFGLLLSSSNAFAILPFLAAAAPYLAAASAVAAVGSAVLQYQAGKDTAAANKQIQRANALRAARERIQQVREARIRAAQIEQGSEGANVSTSSAPAGGVGSVQSQLGSNLNFMDITQIYGDKATNYLADAANKQTLAGIVSAVGSLSNKGAKIGGFNTAPTKT